MRIHAKSTIALLVLLPLPVLYGCGEDFTGPGGIEGTVVQVGPRTPTLVIFPDLLTLKPGESSQLGIFLERRGPDLAPPELEVTWYSSDAEVVNVSEDGTITAITEGEVVIYAEYGGLLADAAVIVRADADPLVNR